MIQIIVLYISVKPRIMNKDSLKPVRVKVGTQFSIPVEFVAEPPPKIEWKKKGMVSMIKFLLPYFVLLKYCISAFSL